MTLTYSPDNQNLVIGVPEEIVLITPERRNRSCDAQLAAGAHICALGQDVTRIVFSFLPLSGRICASHVCAFWRWLAVNDPLLWTTLNGPPSRIPILWSRSGAAAVDVNLRDSAMGDVLSCLSAHLSRIRSLNIRAREEIAVEEWQRTLDALNDPTPALTRLLLDGPYGVGDQGIFPSGVLIADLRELAIVRITGLDLAMLPSTLTSFAYGDTMWGDNRLTLEGLNTILRQCPQLRNLWLGVQLRSSFAQLDAASPPRVSLRKLTFESEMGDGLPLTQRTLDYLSWRHIHSVDVSNTDEDPADGVLQAFDATSMSIHPTRWYFMSHYDITVTDAKDRLRRVRAADYLGLFQYRDLWAALMTLTICGDMVKPLPCPPPSVPRLETLQIFYRRSRLERTIDAIEPWMLDVDHDDGWDCPNLRTLEILSGNSAADAKRLRDTGTHIELSTRSILSFAKGQLSGGTVQRVFVRGESFRVVSDSDQLPFELVVDQSSCMILMLDTEASFSGFD